jgi:hypothetical protein
VADRGVAGSVPTWEMPDGRHTLDLEAMRRLSRKGEYRNHGKGSLIDVRENLRGRPEGPSRGGAGRAAAITTRCVLPISLSLDSLCVYRANRGNQTDLLSAITLANLGWRMQRLPL